jgi:NAD-dependent dihydropyrimidine dehydrogenase PreA subunit
MSFVILPAGLGVVIFYHEARIQTARACQDACADKEVPNVKPVVNSETCIACATCQSVCPADPNVFEVTDVSRVIHPEACTECQSCVDNCPTGSIQLED